MKKLLVLTLILALAAPVAMAQPGQGGGDCDGPGFGPQGMHRGMGKHMGQHDGMPGLRAILAHADELKLTDEQQDKLEKMMTTFQTERVDKKAALEKAEINLRALMRDDADQGQIFAAIDQVAKLKADMKKMHYTHFQQAKGVLTAEQVDQLKQFRKKTARMRGQNPNCPGPGQGQGPGQGMGFGPQGG
ncbi:MAG: hypothetical protein AB1483_04780 [Candidatus Zixiibacteriota bacterium]